MSFNGIYLHTTLIKKILKQQFSKHEKCFQSMLKNIVCEFMVNIHIDTKYDIWMTIRRFLIIDRLIGVTRRKKFGGGRDNIR